MANGMSSGIKMPHDLHFHSHPSKPLGLTFSLAVCQDLFSFSCRQKILMNDNQQPENPYAAPAAELVDRQEGPVVPLGFNGMPDPAGKGARFATFIIDSIVGVFGGCCRFDTGNCNFRTRGMIEHGVRIAAFPGRNAGFWAWDHLYVSLLRSYRNDLGEDTGQVDHGDAGGQRRWW